MKYTIESIQKTGKQVKFLFFWGHQPRKDGQISKSCLSQWWVSDFVVNGITYPTAEHFMMAEKARLFGDDEILENILQTKSAPAAKKLGRKVKNFDGKSWDVRSVGIVKEANYHKFSQNKQLKEFLMQTKNRVLVEASPVDAIWGVGLAEDDNNASNPRKWKGQNLLGFVLMEVRDRIRDEV